MLPESEDDEVTETEEEEEEEERIKDEIVEHPTRDDWHEQREGGQTCEAVVRTRSSILTIRLMRTSRSTRRAARSA